MKFSYPILLCICLGLFLLHLNYLYVDIMEARNFVTAREMLNDGNWLMTTINGEPRYQKPPLPTWLSAGMGAIFGTQNVWALRFPAAVSTIVLIVGFYHFLRKETQNKKLAALGGLILATSFLVLFEGKRANWDTFTYSFAFLGVYFFWLSFKSQSKQLLHFTLAGIFMGCSILSKGPTGIYTVVAPFLLAYCFTYGLPKIKWAYWFWTAILTLLIGFSWYAYLYIYDHDTLLSILEIESKARTNRAVKPFTRYLSFPMQMGVWGVLAVFSLIIPWFKRQNDHTKTYRLLFWWVLICLVLLSLVPSKKERYLFPLMIPLAGTTAYYLYQLTQTTHWKRWEKNLVRLAFGINALAALSVPVLVFIVLKIPIGFYALSFSIASFLIGIYLFFHLFKNLKISHLIGGSIFFIASGMLLGVPVIDQIFNNNPTQKPFVGYKENIQQSGLKLYGFDAYIPEIWFKYGEVIPNLDFNLKNWESTEDEFLLLLNPDEFKEEKLAFLSAHKFQFNLLETFDDNEEKLGQKNNSSRKIILLYHVKKLIK